MTPVSLQVLDLLSELQARCAEVEGQDAALAWRASISGVCVDQSIQQAVCVEENGEQLTEHWLIDWLNARLIPAEPKTRTFKRQVPQGEVDHYVWPLSIRHEASYRDEPGASKQVQNLVRATIHILKSVECRPMTTYDLLGALDRSFPDLPPYSTMHFMLRCFGESGPYPFIHQGEPDIHTYVVRRHRYWRHVPFLPAWAR